MINIQLPRTGVAVVDRAMEFISRGFDKVDEQALMEAIILTPQAIATTDTKVYHGLGRLPVGFFVVDSQADVRVWRSAQSTSAYMTLRASSAQTVTLAVF